MELSAIDSKPIDARPKVFETDEELQESIEGVMECLRVLLEQPLLRYFQVPLFLNFVFEFKTKSFSIAMNN